MPIVIAVTNPTSDEETSLFRFSYNHLDCLSDEMQWHRDPVNDIVSLRCKCGYSISFPQHGEASNVIARVSIDNQTRYLPNTSFTSSSNEEVQIASGGC